MRLTLGMSSTSLALALALGCGGGSMEDTDAGTTLGIDRSDGGSTPATDGGGVDAASPESDGGTPPDDGGTQPDDGGSDALSDGGSRDGGSDVSDGGPSDGGPGDGAVSCAAGTVRIEDTCPAFTACGGDAVGTWCYADVCITKDELLGPALMGAASELPDCTVDQIEVRSSSGTIEGTVTVSAKPDTFARQVASSVRGEFYLGPDCVYRSSCFFTQFGLNAVLSSSTSGASSGRATCTDESRGCLCDITFNTMVNDSHTATVAGTTITLDNANRTTFDYCVEADGRLRFQEQDDSEPGLQTTLPMSAP